MLCERTWSKKEFKQIYTCLNTLKVGQVPMGKVSVGSGQENGPQISTVKLEDDFPFVVLERNLPGSRNNAE